MAPLVRLALASLWNRRLTAGLTLVSITLSVVLLLGVEKLRTEARTGFYNTVSGVDLIVGARTSPIQLLLYSVFRIGDATANVSVASHERIRAHPQVAWSIPLSLGDAHRGMRVLGTDGNYLKHYRHGDDRALRLVQGVWFDDLFDAVLGSQAARDLGYELDDALVLAHGTHEVSFAEHDQMPFRVAGILAPTGTPVDRTIHVSLAAIEAIHLGWEAGIPLPGRMPDADAARAEVLEPRQITAFMLGLRSPVAVFQLQQVVNGYSEEPLLAILPTVALAQFFGLIGIAEDALLLVSMLVVVVGLAGMMTMLLASLSERRREMAILRSVGARPMHVFVLLTAEAALLTVAGAVLGVLLLQLAIIPAAPWLEQLAGVALVSGLPSAREWLLLALVVGGGTLCGAAPAWFAYRRSLVDGLTVRV